jgi:carbonic anhydrase
VRKLIMGIVDFRERMLPQYERRFEALALSQVPDALFVICSDSRVVPDLLASTEPGDLFTMRDVGNLIPPATAEGISIGDLKRARSSMRCLCSRCQTSSCADIPNAGQ